MPPVPSHSREIIERVRQMYRDGARVRDICAATGMSTGTLYYHLDGKSFTGAAAPRLPRRREMEGNALKPFPSRGRQQLTTRLFRAAERQARKIEFRLAYEHQTREGRAEDLHALRELTRILRDLASVEESASRAAARERGGARVEHEQALAVEGRAVVISRTKTG